MFRKNDALVVIAAIGAVIAILLFTGGTATLVTIGMFLALAGMVSGFRLHRTGVFALDAGPAETGTGGDDVERSPPVPQNAREERAGDCDPLPPAAPHQTIAETCRNDAGGDHQSTGERLSHQALQAMPQGIAIKNRDGCYVLINPAFAEFVDEKATAIVGRRDGELLGTTAAALLEEQDAKACEDGAASTVIALPGRKGSRIFDIHKIVLPEREGEPEAVLSVWHDVTETTQRRQRRDKAMYHAIVALTRAIGFSDTYLADHAVRVSHTAERVAEHMGLDEEAVLTVELAGYLSQLGKLALDRDLLHKPGLLTGEERRQVEQHVHHTARLLRNIDFGLPVRRTLFQMHERLDGSGYPHGLRGAQIVTAARILGACDVFNARIAARAHRPGIDTEQALTILEQNPQRYDAQVVSSLRAVVAAHGPEPISSP